MHQQSPIRPPWLAALVALVVAVATAALVALGSAPAHAEHQTCHGDYPTGTLNIGYPDLNASKDIGWGGQVAMNRIDASVFATSAIKSALLDGADVATAVAEIIHEKHDNALILLDSVPELVAAAILGIAEAVARVVAIGLVVGALLTYVAETAVMAVQRNLAGRIAGEDACASVLMGDMVDHLWVAAVQRNLASDGPPLALLLIPTDHEEAGGNAGEWPLQPQHEEEDYAWCPEITLPDKLPAPAATTDLDQPDGPRTGGDCTPGYYEGFLNHPHDGAPRITVQAIVSDTIDHAKAHGLDVRNAEAEYQAAVTALGAGRYKKAFGHFRSAYQAASGLDG